MPFSLRILFLLGRGGVLSWRAAPLLLRQCFSTNHTVSPLSQTGAGLWIYPNWRHFIRPTVLR